MGGLWRLEGSQCVRRFIFIIFSKTYFVQCGHFPGKQLRPVVLHTGFRVSLPGFRLDYITSYRPSVRYLFVSNNNAYLTDSC